MQTPAHRASYLPLPMQTHAGRRGVESLLSTTQQATPRPDFKQQGQATVFSHKGVNGSAVYNSFSAFVLPVLDNGDSHGLKVTISGYVTD